MPADIITYKFLELLSGREWVDAEEVFTKLGPMVNPGKAIRTYERRSGQHRVGNGTRPELQEYEKIASGARAVLQDRIRGQLASGKIEREVLPNGTRRYRLVLCPECQRPFRNATPGTAAHPPSQRSKKKTTNVVWADFTKTKRTRSSRNRSSVHGSSG